MSDSPHKLGHQLFIDRTTSKRLVNILRKAEFTLQTIYEVYPDGSDERVADPEWIKKCGENNWIVITGDKRIESVPENRQAVIDAKVKVFLLNDSNSRPEIWAAAILLGQYKIQDIIDGNTGPFFATVSKRCDSHIQRPRRPKGFEEPFHTAPSPSDPPAQPSTPEPSNSEEKIDLSRAKPGQLFPK